MASTLTDEQIEEMGTRTLTQAECDVLDERWRQVNVEHWLAGHDDQHGKGELALAGAAYAISGSVPWSERGKSDQLLAAIQFVWPRSWSWTWWKPKHPRRDLVRAAALLIAEIERLDRAEARRGDPTYSAIDAEFPRPDGRP